MHQLSLIVSVAVNHGNELTSSREEIHVIKLYSKLEEY